MLLLRAHSHLRSGGKSRTTGLGAKKMKRLYSSTLCEEICTEDNEFRDKTTQNLAPIISPLGGKCTTKPLPLPSQLLLS